ncbi:hypothetical protein [Streptomyces sp. NPDC007088]|uniref:hypothetical protein n=1 Tax=Streptomyces sp. NPDC007088 TaxID=3364773 RepID=UPI00367BC683
MTESESRGGWKRQGFIPVSRQSSDQAPPPTRPARSPATAPPPPVTREPGPYAAPPPSVPPPPGYGAQRPDPAPDADTEPEFARLWEQWTAEGRTVPGRPDPEWNALARRSPWPR